MNANATGKWLALSGTFVRGDVDELGANIIPQSLQLLLKNEKDEAERGEIITGDFRSC